jgi:hypothetical protein
MLQARIRQPALDPSCRRSSARVLLGRWVLAAVVVCSTAHDAPVLGAWNNCERPAVYYSAAHVIGRSMCCRSANLPSIGVCPGGAPCPGDGQCGGGATCVPTTHASNTLPNIVLITSDDQASCEYGFMGACRTDTLGKAVPPPYTPAIDALAARGKVFPVAHNGANWCQPSRETIITGRLIAQRGCPGGPCRPPGALSNTDSVGSPTVPTIADVLSAAGNGYCSYVIGKGSRRGFDATRPGHIGRTPCTRCGVSTWSGIDPVQCQFDPAACPDPGNTNNPACQTQPLCGEDIGATGPPTGEMNLFLDDVVAQGNDGKNYLPKKFFIWYAPYLPHIPVTPNDVIEHRPHLTFSAPPDQSYCRDFLFGFLCDQPSPGTVRVLGPRFPFASQTYATSFQGRMQGLYGNLWWLDSSVRRIRSFLANHTVETAGGPATLSASTVIMFLSDNGAFLPRSKKKFTENGFRTALIVYDPRHETPQGGNFIVDNDVAHSADVMATVASYAGVPKPAEVPGKNLRGWLESASPQPVREALCGTATRSLNGTKGRYILPRGGRVGQCSAPAGVGCSVDSNCNAAAGQLCAAGGTCAVPGAKPCIDDDDCRVNPGDTETCRFQDRKWCSGSPLQACTTDSQCRATCRVCAGAPSRTCAVDADCGTHIGPCIDAPDDKLACGCGRRMVKYYNDETGTMDLLTDLLSDPDETGLVNGQATASASDPDQSAKLAHRLRCCLDKWWLPPGVTAAGCPGGNAGCDVRVDCSL